MRDLDRWKIRFGLKRGDRSMRVNEIMTPSGFYVGPLADEMHRSYSPIFTQCIRSEVTHSLFTAMGSGGWELEIRSMFFACCRVCELLIL